MTESRCPTPTVRRKILTCSQFPLDRGGKGRSGLGCIKNHGGQLKGVPRLSEKFSLAVRIYSRAVQGVLVLKAMPGEVNRTVYTGYVVLSLLEGGPFAQPNLEAQEKVSFPPRAAGAPKKLDPAKPVPKFSFPPGLGI